MVKKIFKSVKNILFFNPAELLEEEMDLVNEPFYFQGTGGKAVLLIHGWTSTPYEVRRLGKYLNQNGFTAYAPRLSGHGTRPEDLENVRWQDWMRDAREAYEQLKKNHETVYVVGTSIGSNIALMLAKERDDIAGLVLMATPYKLKCEPFVVLLAKVLRRFFLYNKKFYPPTFGVSTTITRVISYQTYPIASALESFELIKASRKNLSSVYQPCLVMQSSSDHLLQKNSLEHIYNKISSKLKKKKYIHQAYHTFISDIRNEHVFEDILDFISQ